MSLEDTLLGQKPMFDDFVARGQRPLSCYHFVSVFAWKDFFDFEFVQLDGCLCVYAHQPEGSFLYLPPLGGDLSMATVEACFKRMGARALSRIENISDKQLPLFQGRGYNIQRKADEYVYRKSDVVGLRGNAYKSQRHDYNYCDKKYAPCIRPYEDEDYQGCVDLFGRWAKERMGRHQDQVYQAMLNDNAQVHAVVIRHHRPLGLVGRVAVIDGQIVAYSFGYALDEKTFCILFEVADLNYRGIAAYIFNRFCADEALGDFQWINTMDDFGMPQVAWTKKALHPAKVIASFTVARNREGHENF